MALPVGITPKTVTFGTALFFNGDIANGTATITAPVNVVHTPTNQPIFSSEISSPIVNGTATFVLCPTDAPGLNRVDWTYKLKVQISGASTQPDPIYFTLPAAGPDVVDLDSLVTVPSSAGVPISATVVTSVNGQTGDVTVSGGAGAAPDASPTVKGIVKLAGDLGGSATAPTVPGLVTKVSFWQPGEVVTAGTIRVAPDGTTISRSAGGTTGAAYDLTEGSFWTVVAGGGATAAPASSVRGARTMPPPSRVITRFASGHAWTGGTDDLTVKLYGDRSYKGVTSGTGTNLTLSSPTFAAQDWTGSYMRVALRIDDPTKVNNLQVFVDSGTVGNAYIASLASGNTAVNLVATDEWQFFTVPRIAFSVPATPGWNNIVSVRIRVQDKSTGPVTVRAAAVELLPDLASVYPNGVLMIEADDGFASHKTLLRPMLDALGVPCTYNPIIERITGGAAGVSIADLQDMQDRSGWQISAHATTQAFHDSTTNTAAQAAVDFAAQKKWLHDNGFHAGADDFALCPGVGGNAWTRNSMRNAVAAYWRSARMFSGTPETVIPSDVLSFRSLGFSGNTNTTLQSNIDLAAGPGGVFSLSVHDLLAGSTNGTSGGLAAIAVNNLQTVIQYALNKGMVPRTRGDWLALR